MNLKLLMVITNDEKKIERFLNKIKNPYNYITHGYGTASKSMLDFFGLVPSEKKILFSIISENSVEMVRENLIKYLNLDKIGNGVGFTIPLSSACQYMQDSFKDKKGSSMEDKEKYHLIFIIVNEGYADSVINAAKHGGANGGTLIKGREIASQNSFKLFNMTIEPEKDIVLIVANEGNKKSIMESIINKNGIKTDARGVIFSLPIDSAVGFNSVNNDVK